jgi:hypothetical protein
MEAITMNAVDIHTHAQKLYAAHGPRALAEAAEKARLLEKAGAKAEAQDWKRIEAALRSLKGPDVS